MLVRVRLPTRAERSASECSELGGVQGPRHSKMERETGIEPATNSLEGCDSTTELLPPAFVERSLRSQLRRGKPSAFLLTLGALPPDPRLALSRDSAPLKNARPNRAPFARRPSLLLGRSIPRPFARLACQPEPRTQ